MMIIDSGKLHSLIRTITCEYLKFYAKGERSSSFIQELVHIIWQALRQSLETYRRLKTKFT